MQLLNFTVGAWLLFREKFSKGAKSLLCPVVDGLVKKHVVFFLGAPIIQDFLKPTVTH